MKLDDENYTAVVLRTWLHIEALEGCEKWGRGGGGGKDDPCMCKVRAAIF